MHARQPTPTTRYGVSGGVCISFINVYYLFMQVSLAPVGEDKFSKLLHTCHNTLAALLEVNV